MARNRDEGGPSDRTCRRCGSDVPADAQFCPSCGSPSGAPESPLVCGHCGHTVESGQQFCVSCGTALSEESSTEWDGTGSPPVRTRDSTSGRDRSADAESGEASGRGRSADAEPDEDESDLQAFRHRLDPYLENGWEIDQDDGDSVELSYQDYGAARIHVALVMFLITLGWGNVLYALYSAAVRRNSVTLHAASDSSHWPDHDPTPSDGPLHWVLGMIMTLFTMLIASSVVDSPASLFLWLWLGGCLLSTATLIPPINERLENRGSLTEFGWQTETEERIVSSSVQCTVCSSIVDSAVERSFEKYFAIAGARITTAESGVNHYCEECCKTSLSTSVDRELGELLDDDDEDDRDIGELLDDDADGTDDREHASEQERA